MYYLGAVLLSLGSLAATLYLLVYWFFGRTAEAGFSWLFLAGVGVVVALIGYGLMVVSERRK